MQERDLDMKMRGLMLLLLGIAGLTVLPLAMAQSLADSGDSSSAAVLPSPGTTHPQLALTYTRPTEKTKLHNYFFDAFGPYPAGFLLVLMRVHWEGPVEFATAEEDFRSSSLRATNDSLPKPPRSARTPLATVRRRRVANIVAPIAKVPETRLSFPAIAGTLPA